MFLISFYCFAIFSVLSIKLLCLWCDFCECLTDYSNCNSGSSVIWGLLCMLSLLVLTLQGKSLEMMFFNHFQWLIIGMFFFTGKTHTIVGDKLAPGIIPRCVQDVFSQISTEIANGKRCKFDVFFSYLEIYNEKVSHLSFWV